jgi:hypothetical protein
MVSTFGDVKNSRIPQCINIAPTDSRLPVYVNECVRRLMTRGLFVGCYGTFDISVSSQLMSLPPHLATLEAMSLCRAPLPIRDSSYQFVESGYGIRDETSPNGSGIEECLLLGNFPTAVDVSSTPSVLNVKCDLATDVFKVVTILGYDQNSNWVRTVVAGAYQNGEQVALAQGGGTNTVTQFSKITDVIPPADLDGQWWIYQGATLLNNYQFWETRPSYKRYLIPFISGVTTTSRVIGRRSFVPVKNDNDYLIIGNLAAIKLGCMAIKSEEEYNFATATILWNGGTTKTGQKIMGAIEELDMELQYELGVGRQVTIDIRPTQYTEPVETLV